jgi:acyl-ACP thioesterase
VEGLCGTLSRLDLSSDHGRRYAVRRPVCLGDVLPSGRVRLDALARYLQDVASDDGIDAAIDADQNWVVRRTALAIARRPVLGDQLEIVTWASGAGARWAERRTTIRSTTCPASVVEADALWVCLDSATRRPARLSARFWEIYGESVAGRTVSSRLTHADPPADGTLDSRPWPLRVSDIDVFEHLNNAATWTAFEDELQRRAPNREVGWAELEYRSAIEPDADLLLSSRVEGDGVRVWLSAGGVVQASGVARLLIGPGSVGQAGGDHLEQALGQPGDVVE